LSDIYDELPFPAVKNDDPPLVYCRPSECGITIALSKNLEVATGRLRDANRHICELASALDHSIAVALASTMSTTMSLDEFLAEIARRKAICLTAFPA
jgi:hypothetical protein